MTDSIFIREVNKQVLKRALRDAERCSMPMLLEEVVKGLEWLLSHLEHFTSPVDPPAILKASNSYLVEVYNWKVLGELPNPQPTSDDDDLVEEYRKSFVERVDPMLAFRFGTQAEMWGFADHNRYCNMEVRE